MVARVPSPGCRGNRLHKAVWSSQMHLAHTAPNSHHALTIINQPTFGSAFFNMWSKNSALDLGHPPGVKFTVWPRYTYQLHHYVPKLLLYTNISQTLGDFFCIGFGFVFDMPTFDDLASFTSIFCFVALFVWWGLVVFCLFYSFLRCNPGWPRTNYIYQAGLKLSKICLVRSPKCLN